MAGGVPGHAYRVLPGVRHRHETHEPAVTGGSEERDVVGKQAGNAAGQLKTAGYEEVTAADVPAPARLALKLGSSKRNTGRQIEPLAASADLFLVVLAGQAEATVLEGQVGAIPLDVFSLEVAAHQIVVGRLGVEI